MNLDLFHLHGVPLMAQAPAIALDQDLMTIPGFSTYQLMELAGLSIASSVYDAYPEAKKVLAIVGPGNNGGDALVAVRHLKHFGFEPFVVYPKYVKKELYINLVTELEQLNIPLASALPDDFDKGYDLILDGIFGISFRPADGIRAPFDSIIDKLIGCHTPIVAIDIPSGWDVELGNSGAGNFIAPDMLVSLSAPKLCAKYFRGRFHYLGGRFLPPFVVEKYGLQNLPKYPGSSQFVQIKVHNINKHDSDL